MVFYPLHSHHCSPEFAGEKKSCGSRKVTTDHFGQRIESLHAYKAKRGTKQRNDKTKA